jgi:2-haloacid dehalogenase
MRDSTASLDRKTFLGMVAGGMATRVRPSPPSLPISRTPRFRAIAFDAFPIFDPRPVSRLAETLFPGRGAELSNTWRARQFEYQWLRALAGRYADFWQTAEDSLAFAAELLELELTSEKRADLLQAYSDLVVWPDVPAALRSLEEAGVRLAFLSNMTASSLEAGIARGGLGDVFEHVLSTDDIRTYKPHPRAYRMALEAWELPREDILFVAFAGWDVAGAKWFGYPTFWLNRLDAPREELGVSPDGVGRGLADLLRFVLQGR